MTEKVVPFKPKPTNPSGINPTEHKVLIKPQDVEKVTAGGIIIPPSKEDQEKFSQTIGHIVAASPLAFNYVEDAEWQQSGGEKPKPGDKVLYAKYAGFNVKGPKDGVEYTVVNDKDICATIEE